MFAQEILVRNMNSTRTIIKFHEPHFTGLKPLGDRLILIQNRWDGELGLKNKTNAPITFLFLLMFC